jgi:hypothetical protein
MTTTKRITTLEDYTAVLPYASELFGVYQPMIGWRSQRQLARKLSSVSEVHRNLVDTLLSGYSGVATSHTNPLDCSASVEDVQVGGRSVSRRLVQNDSFLLAAVAERLPTDRPPDDAGWAAALDAAWLREMLGSRVARGCVDLYQSLCRERQAAGARLDDSALETWLQRRLERESALAGALTDLAAQRQVAILESVFYAPPQPMNDALAESISALLKDSDPFALFDPKHDISNVSLSPLGIVHLFRQYFFELDTFLSSPVGHVWLSPGSTVELIEVSTRRTLVEKTIEQTTSTTQKTETSTTDKDELADAVKSENKTDLKLGASLTVNQSWGTGNATANASLNMDNTQNKSREETHKRMREQSAKLSSEIKEEYKSTFRTVTETTDTTSKRYILTNTGQSLINYELRRKMRQVGVQVQDVGTYLCWESFVDEPGQQLGLANLVHIAKPADLEPVPDQTMIPVPPDQAVAWTANLVWDRDNNDPQYNDPTLGFKVMSAGIPLPSAPEGYEVKDPNAFIEVEQVSGQGEDFSGVWAFRGKLVDGGNHIAAGAIMPPGGMKWDQHVNFVVGGVVTFTPSATMRQDIDKANAAKLAAGTAATAENERKTREAFVTAARDRIEAASNVGTRKYEDLREEERIVVYRGLIGALMSDTLYKMPESTTNDQTRHTLSELINSIFDVDKMLYFVAPEWWKPRVHTHQYVGAGDPTSTFADSITNWSDQTYRPDSYFITEKSRFARMGSSLGWTLQLDGDDLRNAFLNAPWVKAVIPVRPGKELEAMNWLQQVHVEGTDGLDALYQAPEPELATIRASEGVQDVTILDAISYLCTQVAKKYEASLQVGKYPDDVTISDDNKVNATPVDKVYEHGFYPLQGGFRAVTSQPYEVFDQWLEVLPTDQVVPVEVTYDPKTGRQL